MNKKNLPSRCPADSLSLRLSQMWKNVLKALSASAEPAGTDRIQTTIADIASETKGFSK